MDLAAIRDGIAQTLDGNLGCRVYATIPEALAASGMTALVVAAGDPYVTYTEGAGRPSLNEIRLRVVIVPAQQSGGFSILREIDELLSCGTAATRSIRALLMDNQGVFGEACSVSAQSAEIRTITINDFACVVGELNLLLTARC